MANKVIHKHSVVKDSVPSGTTLEFGEIAVNYNENNPFIAIRTSGTSTTDYAKFLSSDKLVLKEDYKSDKDGLDADIASLTTQLGTKSSTAHTHGKITLSGDATGSASIGSGTSAINIAVTVADDSHTHDGRYYTETEVNNLLTSKSDTAHTHSQYLTSVPSHASTSTTYGSATLSNYGHVKLATGDVSTETAATNGVAASTYHNHDGRYYTETEVNDLLANKSNTSHTHSQYLTSSNIKNLTFSAGTFSAKTFDPDSAATTVNIPSKTSHLTNDSGFITSAATVAGAASATSATSAGTAGKVSGTLTIQKNGTTVNSYNGSSATTVNITVPTATSELTNNSGYITSAATVASAASATSAATAGSASKVAGTLTVQKNGTTVNTYNGSSATTVNITVPTSTSDLTNNSGFITSAATVASAASATNATNATNATTASKLGSSNVGSATNPIYLSSGTPKACSYTLGKSVPSNAVFTDTVYTHPTSSGYKHIPSGGSSGQFLGWSADGTAKWVANPNTNTHYTTRIYAGASGTSASTAMSNPYLKVTDDNTYRNQVRFVGGGATTVTSDSAGTITISSTDNNTTYSFSNNNPTLAWGTKSTIGTVGGVALTVTMPANPNTDTNTWRPIYTGVDSTSTTTGASASAVKTAYDKAVSAYNTATGKSSVTFSRSLTSGTKIGSITINGTSTDLYCQTNTDTNTTYSAGNFLTLSNTTFSVNTGTSSTTVARGDHSHSAYASSSHTHSYAPIVHATSATTYGVATTANYGHVKISNGDCNSVATADGLVAGMDHTHSNYAAASHTHSNYLTAETYKGTLTGCVITTGATLVATATTTTNGYSYCNFLNYNGAVADGFRFVGVGGVRTYASAGTLCVSGVTNTDYRVGSYAPSSMSSSSTYYFLAHSGSSAYTGATYRTGLYASGTSAATTLHGCTGYYQDSDETLKTFHGEIPIDIEKLRKLPKSYFTWNADEDGVMQIGTSAQKVRELYPEIVSEEPDTGKLSVDYSKLSIIALKAFDKVCDELDQLKSDMALIKEKLNI